MPETAFVPEVPHARVQLQGVRVDAAALLPGDGYARYVKPFRTVEDIHVTLAVLAYLLREARHRGWPQEFSERTTALLVAFAELATASADAATTHVALAGASSWAQRLYADAVHAVGPHAGRCGFAALGTRCRAVQGGRHGTRAAFGACLAAPGRSDIGLTCCCARCCSARVSAPAANAAG